MGSKCVEDWFRSQFRRILEVIPKTTPYDHYIHYIIIYIILIQSGRGFAPFKVRQKPLNEKIEVFSGDFEKAG